MADLKISALTAASTPLAGTEVLPIVQGGVTTKVAVSDLTAGRAVTATSVNKLTITAPATASTLTIADGKTLAVNDNATLGTGGLTLGNSGGFTAAASKVLTANNSITLAGTDATTHTFPTTSATIARTDAAQTFTGDQTFANIKYTGTTTSSSQPAFSAFPTSIQSDVSNATRILFGTEIFDQSNSFASSIFTAPITGKYQLNVNLVMSEVPQDAVYFGFAIITSNRNYAQYFDFRTGFTSSTSYSFGLSVLADMDAADTAQVWWLQNAGTTSADVRADSSFNGYLAF